MATHFPLYQHIFFVSNWDVQYFSQAAHTNGSLKVTFISMYYMLKAKTNENLLVKFNTTDPYMTLPLALVANLATRWRHLYQFTWV